MTQKVRQFAFGGIGTVAAFAAFALVSAAFAAVSSVPKGSALDVRFPPPRAAPAMNIAIPTAAGGSRCLEIRDFASG